MKKIRRDLEFNLFELLPTARLLEHFRFRGHDKETIGAMLDAAQRIAAEKLAPCNRSCDEREPVLIDGVVRVDPGVAEAFRSIAQAGFIAANHDLDSGGSQSPTLVAVACQSIFKAANISVEAYATLTSAAARVINRFGSGALRSRYVPALLQGQWCGTMAMTEPQAGSSLADIATTARRQADGTHLISGTKIFISGGDHDITQNIVHLVLARQHDAPPGTRGLSLYVVPKLRWSTDGARLMPNDVQTVGLIHKMGFRGTTSTMLRFGESGDCVGELLGEPQKGLAYMFQMMNEARIHVGLGATMLGYAGYEYSLGYATERAQGRATTDVSSPQQPIVNHADVKRMLLAQKAAVEGALALCLYGAWLLDEIACNEDHGTRESTTAILELLTPIIKTWPSHACLEANSQAIQILGGYGYTRDYPVEQYYRDNRLNAIHEGTSGIQALDFLNRKILRDEGAAFELLWLEVSATIAAARSIQDCGLGALARSVEDTWDELATTTSIIISMSGADREAAIANAGTLLEVTGYAVIAWMWLRASVAATRALQSPELAARHHDFYNGKLLAAKYFLDWENSRVASHHLLLRSANRLIADLVPACL